MRQHVAEVIDVVVEARDDKSGREPQESGEADGADQFPVASPDEVGKKGEGKEFEDGRGADQHPAGDVLAALPAGPRPGEQEEEHGVHRSREYRVGQGKEGSQHRDNREQLGAARRADHPVDDHQAGKDRGLDHEQPDPDREVVSDPGQWDQGDGEGRRIQVPTAQRPIPGHVVADEVRIGVATRGDLLGGEQVILEVVGAGRLRGQQRQQEARGVEGQQDTDQGAKGQLTRVGPAQQSPHGRITRGRRQVTPAVTWPLQRTEEPDGRSRRPSAGGCAGWVARTRSALRARPASASRDGRARPSPLPPSRCHRRCPV